ncbi:hypothetical protein EYF80_013375 [Liparis tanakae]|uniref:Uncharacterized protein n=1 Tax=Liparis tanakae TaxID=230148 RepID=A0A4Z2IF30_9TELE|nr:hypothetical protein EYF80_013375 [Liparis tanakae]
MSPKCAVPVTCTEKIRSGLCFDTSHHSPWLCAPPSPSSVSVRLLSIPAPLLRHSAAAGGAASPVELSSAAAAAAAVAALPALHPP